MFMFGMLNDVVLFQYLSLSRVQPNIPLHTSPTKHTAFSAHGAIDEKHTYTLTLSHPFSYYIITHTHTPSDVSYVFQYHFCCYCR